MVAALLADTPNGFAQSTYAPQAQEPTGTLRVLETLLAYAGLGPDASGKAERLLSKFGSLGAVLRAEPRQLATAGALPMTAVAVIGAVLAVHRAALQERLPERLKIESHEALLEFIGEELRHRREEALLALFLDSDYRLISVEVVATGSVNRCPITVRQIVERTLDRGASALILAHNHPSGSMEPSARDIETTRSVQATLRTLDVELLDHVIIGTGAYSVLGEREIV